MNALRRQQRRQAAWKAAAGELWSNPDNLVFTTEFGRYVNNKTLYMNFKRVMRSQGLSELRFHDLRHTFAVNSLKAGDDIKTVQENLGHATASFTLSTYAHATPGMKRESANRMGSIFAASAKAQKQQNPVCDILYQVVRLDCLKPPYKGSK